MKKRIALWALLCPLFVSVSAQRFTDRLDRGLVAVKTTSGVYCSWRINADEYYDVKYNIYRDGVKLNASPLNVSNFTDASGSLSSTYTVRPVVRGVEKSASAAVQVMQNAWKEITPQHDASLRSTYIPNDACCADVDGDGVVEILMKFDNADEINNHFQRDGWYGEHSLFECLKQDGTVLWWVNCGPNMGDFQNNEQNIVAYDWDRDGKAEAVMRLCEGAQIHMNDGTVYTVGGTSWTNHRSAQPAPQYAHSYTLKCGVASGTSVSSSSSWCSIAVSGDKVVVTLSANNNEAERTTTVSVGGTTYYVSQKGTKNSVEWFTPYGKEYLLYVNGKTGVPYQCVDFPLKRLESGENDLNAAWGDGYGHRSNKFFFGAPYLDGKKPSIFLGRGIYTRHKFVALDVDPSTHTLVERWRWTNNKAGSPWYGQGYHNFVVADVDWDGRDEIVWGSMVIDDNGRGLSTTGLGHGDSQHVGDFNPYIHGQEMFACNEDAPANNYRDATTSKIYYRVTGTNDDGRAMCGNFTNDFPGAMGVTAHDYTVPIGCVTNGHMDGFTAAGVTQNFRIYWDGDLLDESFNGEGTRNSTGAIFKYGSWTPMQKLEGSLTNNDTKATPCFQGDIFGDWREEVIMRTADNKIRIYTTTIPTEHRNYSLWYDHQYRNAMVWQMCGYNQTPHPSYFLGELEGITIAPPPLTMEGRTEVKNGGTIDASLNDQHVIVCENSNATVAIADGASPFVATFNVPTHVEGTAQSECTDKDTPINTTTYRLTLTGGAFGGATRVVKQGDGELVFPSTVQTYSGRTDVWAGTLTFNGTMQNSHVWLNRFAELNSDGGVFAKGIEAEYGSVIRPGGAEKAGTLTADSLKLGFGSRVVFDISALEHDSLKTAVLAIEKKEWANGPKYSAPVFEFVIDGSELPAGKYMIAEAAALAGSLDNIVIEGLDGLKAHLSYEEGKVYLVIPSIREAEEVTWTGAESAVWDLDEAANFSSTSGTFVSGDEVTFDDSAVNTSVSVAGDVTPTSVVFKNNSKTYTLSGDGSIAGDGSLAVSGTGTVNVNNVNKYSGGTYLYSGVLVPSSLANADGAEYGALGGVSSHIYVSGGTLKTTKNMTTSQPLQIGAKGATVEVASGTLIHAGTISRNGTEHATLRKTGTGTLQLNGSAALGFDTLYVNQGTVYDFGDRHFSGKTIYLNGGTLKYNDSRYSYNTDNAKFVVPAGKTSTLYVDGRCEYTGSLVGAGTLKLYATYVRCPFQGNWSEFEGTINAYKNSDAAFDFNNTYGLGKATLNIQNGCTVGTNGKNFAIGALTGSGSIRNDGNYGSNVNTLTIGGKNTSFTYSGSIVKCNVNKVGTGDWTVANTTTLAQAGYVTVSQGGLKLNLSSATSTMTGNSTVTVKNEGKIWGRGVVRSLVLQDGGKYVPGTSSTLTSNSGTIKVLGTLTANSGSHIYLAKRSNLDVNSQNVLMYSYVESDGALTVNGTVHLSYSTGWTPAAGDSARVFVASSISGNPTWDLQALPSGLAWDLSTVMTDGIIRVVEASADGITVAPDEMADCSVYTLSGVRVGGFFGSLNTLDADMKALGLTKGVYVVRISTSAGTLRKKVSIK